MRILLTNDDGIFGLGLAAMYKELSRLGTVYVIAPATEQSGVSQSVTFRIPILVKDVFVNEKRWGWGVEGTPADCVKVGMNVILDEKPDLVVSGINWGQNCGINIPYSGTLGAVFEAGMYHIPAFAVSIQDDSLPDFARAAELARGIIEQILPHISASEAASELDACGNPAPHLYNINVSREAVKRENPQVVLCPMDTTPYATKMEGCTDTFGRAYYWLVPNPRARRPEGTTDMNALGDGNVAVTPLQFDATNYTHLSEMKSWRLSDPLKSTAAALKPLEECDFSNVPNTNMRTTKNYDKNREA